MYRSSPFRSTLNTGYITCLGMCKVCTEAVHSVALWTRVTLRWDMCKVCTEAVHSVAIWTRVTLRWDMCKVCTEAVHSVALWTCVVKTCQFHGAVNTSSAKTTTPPKRILWEPKNHPIEKEHYLNQPSMFGFKILVFQGVQSESCQTCVAFFFGLECDNNWKDWFIVSSNMLHSLDNTPLKINVFHIKWGSKHWFLVLYEGLHPPKKNYNYTPED